MNFADSYRLTVDSEGGERSAPLKFAQNFRKRGKICDFSNKEEIRRLADKNIELLKSSEAESHFPV